MKHILIFLLLKVLEIGGIVFLPYWVGRLVEGWSGVKNYYKIETWIVGLGIIMLLVAITMLFGIIIYFNWQWAGRF
jgi:hypothetical protein